MLNHTLESYAASFVFVNVNMILVSQYTQVYSRISKSPNEHGSTDSNNPSVFIVFVFRNPIET